MKKHSTLVTSNIQFSDWGKADLLSAQARGDRLAGYYTLGLYPTWNEVSDWWNHNWT